MKYYAIRHKQTRLYMPFPNSYIPRGGRKWVTEKGRFRVMPTELSAKRALSYLNNRDEYEIVPVRFSVGDS